MWGPGGCRWPARDSLLLPSHVCCGAAQANKEKLEAIFAEFDVDRSGQLDRREVARMIQKLMPDMDLRWGAG